MLFFDINILKELIGDIIIPDWLENFVLALTPEVVASLLLYTLFTSILVFLEYRKPARNNLKISIGFWIFLLISDLFVNLFPQTVPLFWSATGATFIYAFVLQTLKGEMLEEKEEDLNTVERAFQLQGEVVLAGIMNALQSARIRRLTAKGVLEAVADVAKTNVATNPKHEEEYKRIELQFKSLAGVA